MRKLDLRASRECGIPSLTLMENAGARTRARLIDQYGPANQLKVLVAAGNGNNGGDGLVTARLLLNDGVSVSVYLASGEEELKEDAVVNLKKFRETGGTVLSGAKDKGRLLEKLAGDSNLIVDALFGTGLSRPITGEMARIIRVINGSGKKTASLDIPSGVSSDSGEILGEAVRADCTITYAYPKWGHFLFPGAELTGRLFIEEIGIPESLAKEAGLNAELIDLPYARGVFPPLRKRDSHKGTFGHLLVIAGSRGYRGAGALCCRAALRSGAGLVTWAMPESLNGPEGYVPEAMTLPLPETGEGSLSLRAESEILAFSARVDAAIIGPGLSTRPETSALVRKLIAGLQCPLVVDADGMSALSEEPDVLKKASGPVLVTPHPGEMGRLLGLDVPSVVKKRKDLPLQTAKRFGCGVLLKGAYTILGFPDGSVFINSTGNPGMATAGSGDVLSGILGAFLAQKQPFKEAACAGVFLHGLAGDLARREKGEMGLIAGDLVEKIPHGILTIRPDR